MRRAFETAFACGWRATGVPPKFLSLSDITFVAPVEIGALVQFEAQESRRLVLWMDAQATRRLHESSL